MVDSESQSSLRVALLMPSLNEAATVGAAMASIRASTRLPDEIIVIDGGSTDGTERLLHDCAASGMPVRFLLRPGMLPGAARNEGAKNSECDVLLFLDFGNVIDSHWIEEMARPFEADPRIEAVGGLYEPLMTNDFEYCVAAIQYHDATLFAGLSRDEQLARVPGKIRLGGLGMAVRRDTFLRLGGQPHWLRAGEDWLFGQKLLDSEAPVGVALGARLYHHMRPTPGDLFRQNRLYSRGEARLGIGLAAHLRRLLIYGLVLAIFASGLFWWPLLFVGAALVIAYLQHVGAARMQRVFGGDATRGRLGLLSLAVVTKDLGALTGYAWGAWEWLSQPHWRDERRRYMTAGWSPETTRT
ncbi:glycosyltransferase family 2 protein [soil metagenome]